MSFFKKSLKALGFSEEEEEEYTQHTEREVTASPRTTANTGPAEPAAPAAPTNNGGETLPDSLLEHIVELINASLPDFVRTCIDRESEKRYIYEHLGDSFKNYIAELRGQARSTVEQEVAATRQKLEEERHGSPDWCSSALTGSPARLFHSQRGTLLIRPIVIFRDIFMQIMEER